MKELQVGQRVDILCYIGGEMIPIYNVRPVAIREKSVTIHCPEELVEFFGLDIFTPYTMPLVHIPLAKIKYVSKEDRFLIGGDHKRCKWAGEQ